MEALLIILIFYIIYFIYKLVCKLYWTSIVKKSQIDFFNVRGYKVYLHTRNFSNVWKIITSNNKSAIDEIGTRFIKEENEYGNIPSDKMKERYDLTKDYLVNQFKKSKKEFIEEYYNFNLEGNYAIENSREILYYYIKSHNLGEIFHENKNFIEEIDFSETGETIKNYGNEPFIITITTKHIYLEIDAKQIVRIEGNLDRLILTSKHQSVLFEKKKIKVLN